MPDDGSTPRVLCAGILVADLFVPPIARLPEAGALCATDDFLLDTGGCAANVGTGLARLGVGAAVTGCVGRDPFGDFIAADLKEKGLDTSAIQRADDFGTSKTVILTVEGEDRRFIHTFGANAAFRAEDVDISGLGAGDILYFGGYLVMPRVAPEPLNALFRTARDRGVRTVLDVVVPASAPDSAAASLFPVLPEVDFFLPNDEEARALTGEADPERQAARFLAAGCGTVVITQGARGTLWRSERERYRASTYAVPFVDGSGSGDAFAAGFILGLLEGWPAPDTLRFASAIGASACTKLGCTTGVFTRREADEFIAGNRIEITGAPAGATPPAGGI